MSSAYIRDCQLESFAESQGWSRDKILRTRLIDLRSFFPNPNTDGMRKTNENNNNIQTDIESKKHTVTVNLGKNIINHNGKQQHITTNIESKNRSEKKAIQLKSSSSIVDTNNNNDNKQQHHHIDPCMKSMMLVEDKPLNEEDVEYRPRQISPSEHDGIVSELTNVSNIIQSITVDLQKQREKEAELKQKLLYNNPNYVNIPSLMNRTDGLRQVYFLYEKLMNQRNQLYMSTKTKQNLIKISQNLDEDEIDVIKMSINSDKTEKDNIQKQIDNIIKNLRTIRNEKNTVLQVLKHSFHHSSPKYDILYGKLLKIDIVILFMTYNFEH